MPEASVPNKRPAKVTQMRKPVEMKSPSGVTYSLEVITPTMAEQWLAKNVQNRRLRKAVMARYSRDMKSKTWIENGSSIVFDKAGRLSDGQHRLEACVEVGVPFLTLVVRGVAEDAQNTMDDGAKRTLADRFDFLGKSNTSAAASIVRRILLWDAGFQTNTGTYQPTTHEAIELLDSDPTVELAVECAVSMRGAKLLPPSIIGLAWWLFWDIDPDGCQTFWDGIHVGAGLSEDSPVLVLRNQIIRKASEPGRIPETVILAWVIKAWNDFREDRTRVRPYNLRAGEKFPEPR
jgi:hypothetical protein